MRTLTARLSARDIVRVNDIFRSCPRAIPLNAHPIQPASFPFQPGPFALTFSTILLSTPSLRIQHPLGPTRDSLSCKKEERSKEGKTKTSDHSTEVLVSLPFSGRVDIRLSGGAMKVQV
jgi:hypothetical protein